MNKDTYDSFLPYYERYPRSLRDKITSRNNDASLSPRWGVGRACSRFIELISDWNYAIRRLGQQWVVRSSPTISCICISKGISRQSPFLAQCLLVRRILEVLLKFHRCDLNLNSLVVSETHLYLAEVVICSSWVYIVLNQNHTLDEGCFIFYISQNSLGKALQYFKFICF